MTNPPWISWPTGGTRNPRMTSYSVNPLGFGTRNPRMTSYSVDPLGFRVFEAVFQQEIL